MSANTQELYTTVVQDAKFVFLQKTKDYGTAWRVLRDISIVDQIYIKVKRICTLQESHVSKVGESIEGEWIGVINYAVIGLIQRTLNNDCIDELDINTVEIYYDQQIERAFQLMQKKNHDYGEAWKDMHSQSIADICMMKIYRMRQILENKEQILASEGIEANYLDVLNYAVFYLINNS